MRILEEIKENLSVEGEEKWRFFNFKELSKLVHLHAAICEALRLCPPVPFEHKDSIESDIPSGHHIGRNTRIIYSLYSMGRMKETWGEDCQEFKPERWISDQGQIKPVSPYKFIVFNARPRTCLGKDLTLVQMKAIASAVFWNYRFQVVEDHPIYPTASMVLHIMKHSLKVRVLQRRQS